jgi:hypothetical protein
MGPTVTLIIDEPRICPASWKVAVTPSPRVTVSSYLNGVK